MTAFRPRTQMVNARRRRNRKAALWVRDGARCAYCRLPFPDLGTATVDHVAPYRLLRTWSARHLVLACRPCNRRKADRLPLTVALLLLAHHPGWSPDQSADSDPTGDPTGRPSVGWSGGDRSGPDWRLLARLAHMNQETHRVNTPTDPVNGPTRRAFTVNTTVNAPADAVFTVNTAMNTRADFVNDPTDPVNTREGSPSTRQRAAHTARRAAARGERAEGGRGRAAGARQEGPAARLARGGARSLVGGCAA